MSTESNFPIPFERTYHNFVTKTWLAILSLAPSIGWMEYNSSHKMLSQTDIGHTMTRGRNLNCNLMAVIILKMMNLKRLKCTYGSVYSRKNDMYCLD